MSKQTSTVEETVEEIMKLFKQCNGTITVPTHHFEVDLESIVYRHKEAIRAETSIKEMMILQAHLDKMDVDNVTIGSIYSYLNDRVKHINQ